MKFKILNEDNSSLNTGEDYDIYVIDNEYYYYDGTTYQKVPAHLLGPIITEYENQERLEKLKNDPTWDEEKARKEDEARLNRIRGQFVGSTEVQGLKDEIDQINKAERYKRNKKRQERAKKRPLVNPSLEEMEQSISDFMDNLLEPEDSFDFRNTYNRPNPYKELDPRFRMKSRQRYRMEDNDEKEKPLVLFYYDRSGSFDPRTEPGKTQLGKDIIAMFDKYSDQVDMKVLYFSTIVSENEEEALARIGNNSEVLIKDIQLRTKNHIANVVILTDTDNGYAQVQVEVNGAAWLVFANAYDPTLQENIRGKLLTKQFFFTGL